MRGTTSIKLYKQLLLTCTYLYTLARYRSPPSPIRYVNLKMNHSMAIFNKLFSSFSALGVFCKKIAYLLTMSLLLPIKIKKSFYQPLLVKGRMLVLPPFVQKLKLPSVRHFEFFERSVFFLTVELPSTPTYRRTILPGHFQLFILNSFHQPESLFKESKFTFLFYGHYFSY